MNISLLNTNFTNFAANTPESFRPGGRAMKLLEPFTKESLQAPQSIEHIIKDMRIQLREIQNRTGDEYGVGDGTPFSDIKEFFEFWRLAIGLRESIEANRASFVEPSFLNITKADREKLDLISKEIIDITNDTIRTQNLLNQISSGSGFLVPNTFITRMFNRERGLLQAESFVNDLLNDPNRKYNPHIRFISSEEAEHLMSLFNKAFEIAVRNETKPHWHVLKNYSPMHPGTHPWNFERTWTHIPIDRISQGVVTLLKGRVADPFSLAQNLLRLVTEDSMPGHLVPLGFMGLDKTDHRVVRERGLEFAHIIAAELFDDLDEASAFLSLIYEAHEKGITTKNFKNFRNLSMVVSLNIEDMKWTIEHWKNLGQITEEEVRILKDIAKNDDLSKIVFNATREIENTRLLLKKLELFNQEVNNTRLNENTARPHIRENTAQAHIRRLAEADRTTPDTGIRSPSLDMIL